MKLLLRESLWNDETARLIVRALWRDVLDDELSCARVLLDQLHE